MTGDDFDKVVAPVRALIALKGQDYNSSVKLEDYFPMGDLSYLQMLHMKTLRLRSLLNNGNTKPNFDSVLDTTQDLLAYTVFYLHYLEKKNDKPV